MILKLIMELLKFFLLFIIGLMPAVPDVSGMVSFINPVFTLLGGLNNFVSVSVAGTCLTVLLVFMNIEFIWGIIMWVVRKIPGVT